jgi:hypothetical protein
MVNARPYSIYPRERDPVPFVKEGEWASRTAGMGPENLAATEVRTPDRSLVASRYTDYTMPVVKYEVQRQYK